MRKAVERLLIGLMVTGLPVIVALPVAVPPIVENVVRGKLHELGLTNPYVRMNLGYCWRNGPGLAGKFTLTLLPSWFIVAEFGASCCEWSASVKMPETTFTQDDDVLRALLEKHPISAVSNLTFSGSIALDAHAERTFHTPVPVWSAKLPIKNLSVGLTMEDKIYSVQGFSVTPAASGLADHIDIATLRPRAKSITASGFELSDFHASVRVTDRAILVTEAAAGFCGGQVNLFSLFLDPKNLNTGFTLFLDDVNAGEALTHLNGFSGEASGRLHGKVKLFVREGGKAIRLSDAFLYSTPGEIGKLKLADPAPITDNLAMAGIDEATRANVADALADLDYSVLRLNLKRGEGRSATLSTTVRGTATRGKMSVPVDLALNFNGDLEQLINTGLGYSNLLKGTQK